MLVNTIGGNKSEMEDKKVFSVFFYFALVLSALATLGFLWVVMTIVVGG